VVSGFGGMRDHDGTLTFAPRLPERMSRVTFRLTYRGRCLVVTIEPERAQYRLQSGSPLEVTHHGEPLTAVMEEAVSRPIPPPAGRQPPSQPPGREPGRQQG
jgi:alpha,alpha-trehalose phosphorylase